MKLLLVSIKSWTVIFISSPINVNIYLFNFIYYLIITNNPSILYIILLWKILPIIASNIAPPTSFTLKTVLPSKFLELTPLMKCPGLKSKLLLSKSIADIIILLFSSKICNPINNSDFTFMGDLKITMAFYLILRCFEISRIRLNGKTFRLLMDLDLDTVTLQSDIIVKFTFSEEKSILWTIQTKFLPLTLRNNAGGKFNQ